MSKGQYKYRESTKKIKLMEEVKTKRLFLNRHKKGNFWGHLKEDFIIYNKLYSKAYFYHNYYS